MSVFETKLLESIDKIESWVNTTETFIETQAPLVVQEILRWGKVQNMIGFVITALVLIFIMFICWGINNHNKLYRDDPLEDASILYIPVGIAFVFTFGLLISFLCDYTYIVVAPRLYIINQLREMLK